MVKTYFYTNELTTTLPNAFVYSKNPRFIEVIHCRAKYKDYLVGDIKMHSTFIQRDGYMDNFVMFINTILTKYKKYEYTGTKSTFTLNFTDMNGNDVSDDIDEFVLEMLLIY